MIKIEDINTGSILKLPYRVGNTYYYIATKKPKRSDKTFEYILANIDFNDVTTVQINSSSKMKEFTADDKFGFRNMTILKGDEYSDFTKRIIEHVFERNR